MMGAVLASVALLASAVPGSARGYSERSRRLAPGVRYTVIRDPSGPFRIRIVSVQLSRASTLDVELGRNKLPGFETTSSMARRNNAIVAINGDYARDNGRPVMAFAKDGHLVQTPLVWGRNFAVDTSETYTFIGHPHVSAWAYEYDSDVAHSIERVNNDIPAFDEIARYTTEGGRGERPPSYSCSARLYPVDVPRYVPDRGGVETVHRVDKTACKTSRMYLQSGTVVAAQLGSAREAEVASLVPDEEVALGWSLGWTGVFDTVGGNPTLVEEGRISVRQENDRFFWRHPRTGVGSTPDGRVLLVTVDGRQPRYSVGMTPRQFAKLFISLGADYALNLDGGGSTTMVINGRVMNRPSDGNERAVSSALLLLPGADPGEPTPSAGASPSPTPSYGLAEASETWKAIAGDAASTGGLTSSLLKRGAYLPPSLRRTARAFNRR